MTRRYALLILVIAIICLNTLIYIRAQCTIANPNEVFAECARNSGRTAAAVNLVILLMIGHYGLLSIFKNKRKHFFLFSLSVTFAINHLIHFYFVYQSFSSKNYNLAISENIHGFITYLSILLAPVIISRFKPLGNVSYYLLLLHFYNVTYFISVSFWSRYKPVDPAYLHRLGVLIMIIALSYVAFRVYRERTSKLTA